MQRAVYRLNQGNSCLNRGVLHLNQANLNLNRGNSRIHQGNFNLNWSDSNWNQSNSSVNQADLSVKRCDSSVKCPDVNWNQDDFSVNRDDSIELCGRRSRVSARRHGLCGALYWQRGASRWVCCCWQRQLWTGWGRFDIVSFLKLISKLDRMQTPIYNHLNELRWLPK